MDALQGTQGKTANGEIPPMVQPAKTEEKEISRFNAYDNAECQIPRNMNLKTVRESFVQYQKREYPPVQGNAGRYRGLLCPCQSACRGIVPAIEALTLFGRR